FFGQRHWVTVEKGGRHRAERIFDRFDDFSGSGPVPFFHSTKPTLQFSWKICEKRWSAGSMAVKL
ncbi:MAG TPA: hypothetical protein VE890_02945, partial [Thermoguttaceae bacterium]|nr:hypothetical protein [Thermoguttaceae bacterium]